MLPGLKLTPAVCVPVPLNATLCGELATESVNVKEADRLPAAVGAKVTETVQLLDAASTLPHVVLIPKSAVFVPFSQMLRMLSAPVPVLESVTVLAALTTPTLWFPNAKPAGEIETCGTAATFPLPVSDACWDAPATFSEFPVTVSVPFNGPLVEGTSAIAAMQAEPAPSTDDVEQSV